MKKPSRNSVYLALIFVVATALVVYFMPGDNKHKYNYELNRPWSYGLLTAPFDIPVYRDSATVKLMIDSVDREFVPIFQRESSAKSKVVAVVKGSTKLSETTRRKLLATIDMIYSRGVIDAKTAGIIAHGGLPEVSFNVDNFNETHSTERFMSQRDAYAYIDSVFSDSSERGEVQSLGLATLLSPNIVEDKSATEQYRNTLIQPIVAAVGVIQKGERIIDRGDRVSPQLYEVLKSYEQALEKTGTIDRNRQIYTLIGQTAFAVCIFVMLYVYFFFFTDDGLKQWKRLLPVMLLMVLLFVFAAVLAQSFNSGIYMVPLALLPIVIQALYDSKMAFFVFVLEVLLTAVLSSFQLEYIFVEVTAGTVAIISLRELSKRSQLLRSALMAFVTYVVGYVAVELMSAGDIDSLSGRILGYFAINAVLISFAYILIFIMEKVFGLTSVVTLVELSDINNPLLRDLSRECPGTFQHSMAVSNLASEAAHKIGANVQLVRAAALYHDIGKIDNPAFFTENQYGINPHDALSPAQSARIIISHVTDGLKRADKAKLPGVIKDLILQHHGQGVAKYFYVREQQNHPGEEIDPAPFSYPGPNPQTREASLLMMADAVEAASRSLTDHSEEAIKALVDKLIDQQVVDGRHNESPLSFKDIAKVKETFIMRLRSMYHGRVSYPPEAQKIG
jgi:hypothetical protein